MAGLVLRHALYLPAIGYGMYDVRLPLWETKEQLPFGHAPWVLSPDQPKADQCLPPDGFELCMRVPIAIDKVAPNPIQQL